MSSTKNFETLAIRSQLERTQFSNLTPMYVTSSFVFDDAEDMRASFAEEKERNIIVDLQVLILQNSYLSYVL